MGKEERKKARKEKNTTKKEKTLRKIKVRM